MYFLKVLKKILAFVLLAKVSTFITQRVQNCNLLGILYPALRMYFYMDGVCAGVQVRVCGWCTNRKS
jgi:hypothetical protein